MQKHIHLPTFSPKERNIKKNVCGFYRKMFATREISKLKKGKIKAIYCYAAQHYYMRLLQ